MHVVAPLLAGFGFAITSGAAPAAVTVSFREAGSYSDAGDPWEADRTLDELKRHLERLAGRYLSPSQILRIEVLDIDLAGRTHYFWHRRFSEVRVLNGRGDWPSIKLRYTLESGGRIFEAREETVADRAYMLRSGPGAPNRWLYYEKRMLDDWFRRRFVEAAQPPL